MSKVIRWILIAATAALAHCGGGSGGAAVGAGTPGTGTGGSTLQSGQLVDEPVAGASYYSSSGAGGCTASAPCQTGGNGGFQFAAGDTVTFVVFGIKLGSAQLAGTSDGSVTLVKPNMLTGETDPAAPGAVNVATFLHMVSSENQQALQVNTGLDANAVKAAVPGGDAAQITDFGPLAGVTGQSVPLDSDIKAILTQTASLTPAAVPFVGSVWRGTCDSGCGGGTFGFKSDGEVIGITDDGGVIAGTWTVGANGSAVVNMVSSKGGSATGTIAAGSASCTACLALQRGNGASSTLSLNLIASTAGATNPYGGVWYVRATVTPQGAAAGNESGSAVVLAAPDGKMYGVTDAGESFTGTWGTADDGKGTMSVPVDQGQQAGAFTFDLAARTGTLSVGGSTYFTLDFSRSNGPSTEPIFTLRSSNTNTNTVPMVLNLDINWKNMGGSGTGGYSESLALDAHVDDSSGNRLTSTPMAEHTFILFGTANVPPTTDNIALSYPAGAGASYHVTFGNGQATMTDPGGMTCTIINGDGAVNDAYGGDPSKYATVSVDCR
jgi:hypothetical protein